MPLPLTNTQALACTLPALSELAVAIFWMLGMPPELTVAEKLRVWDCPDLSSQIIAKNCCRITSVKLYCRKQSLSRTGKIVGNSDIVGSGIAGVGNNNLELHSIAVVGVGAVGKTAVIVIVIVIVINIPYTFGN